MLSAALGMPVVSSCSEDDPENPEVPPPGEGGDEDPDDPSGGDTPGGTATLSVSQQKQKLKDAGLELTGKFSASDFRYYSDLSEHVDGTLFEDYRTTELEDWYEDCLDVITSFLHKEESSNPWGYNYVTTYNKRIYAASAFKGHFKAQNGRWVRTDADDLQFTFPDQTGATCVVRLAAGGRTKTVYVSDTEDWDWAYDTQYITVRENYLSVPENVTLTLTQNGLTKVSVSVKTDLSSMAGEEFDLSRDAFSATADVKVDSYAWTVSRAAYRAGGQAGLASELKKGGQLLLSVKASADRLGFDADDELTAGDKVTFEADVLGKVQFKGEISNIKDFVNYLKRADENNDSESSFKSNLNMAGNLLKTGVYYDGNPTRQAGVKLEPFSYRAPWGGEDWWYEPVIYFDQDGSSVSILEDFFNEEDFGEVIDKFEQLVEDFREMLGLDDEWDEPYYPTPDEYNRRK